VTRLADIICASSHPMFRRFAERLRSAVRFEIAPEVGAMAHAVKDSSAGRLKSAMQFCRLPFDLVWLEWLGPAASLGVSNGASPVDPLRPVPCRMGVLVESGAGRLDAGMVSYAWAHNRTVPNVAVLSTTFDWGAIPSAVPTIVEDTQAPFDYVSSMRKFIQYKKDNANDLLALRGRHGVVPCPYMAEAVSRLIAARPWDVAPLMDGAWQDIRGEQRFVEALLATLNFRNLVQVDPEENWGVLNKARRKLGRPAKLSFRKVVVSVSRVHARKCAAAKGAGGGGMPLHIVRGHPKIRKTGIYWWSPFLRGDEAYGRIDRSKYEVRS
jgi:hypothetical protein